MYSISLIPRQENNTENSSSYLILYRHEKHPSGEIFLPSNIDLNILITKDTFNPEKVHILSRKYSNLLEQKNTASLRNGLSYLLFESKIKNLEWDLDFYLDEKSNQIYCVPSLESQDIGYVMHAYPFLFNEENKNKREQINSTLKTKPIGHAKLPLEVLLELNNFSLS